MQAADVEAELADACCERDALRLRVSGLEEELAKATATAAAAQAETVHSNAAESVAAAEARRQASPAVYMAILLLPPTACCP